uniref:RING-type E3 ubiquitin transferase n=1 Tax=Aegilops tauschii subsp. strangulata TaxID=200361 RepID=A0A453AFQ3_AEGTS
MAFVLIARGNCSFEGKVRAAQRAGFDAALVHDDEDKASLYSMVGDPEGIHIPAVFVSKMAGETLKKFARGEDEFHVECIDPWLTKWGTFCPVCKLEVLTGE